MILEQPLILVILLLQISHLQRRESKSVWVVTVHIITTGCLEKSGPFCFCNLSIQFLDILKLSGRCRVRILIFNFNSNCKCLGKLSNLKSSKVWEISQRGGFGGGIPKL